MVVYEVDEEGELVGLPGLSRDVLGSEKVVIVVAERQKKIYLWKGKRSSVKKKFVGARKAADLRAEWGLTFKVVAVDEGEEDSDFLGLMGAKAEAPVRAQRRAEAAVEVERARTEKVEAVQERVAEKARAEKVEIVQERVAERVRVPAERVEVVQERAAERVRVQPVERVEVVQERVIGGARAEKVEGGSAVSGVRVQPGGVQGGGQLSGDLSEEFVLSKLSEVGVPEGYVREMVVVGPCVYVVKEVRSSIFGRERVERRLERVEPPEGVFVVEDFVTRVIVDGGRVVAVEFLREDKGRGVEALKSEMVKHLEDIISAFRSG